MTTSESPPQREWKRFYLISEVCDIMRVSRASLYRLMARDGLPRVWFGRAVRIPAAEFEVWLAQRVDDH